MCSSTTLYSSLSQLLCCSAQVLLHEGGMSLKDMLTCRRIVVEDVQLTDAFREEHALLQGAVSRRMVFRGISLVQSEALMVPARPSRYVSDD